MIMQLIGIKRVVILGILLGINIAIAAVFFLWLEPMRSSADTQLSSIRAQISAVQKKINDVKRELADFEKNLPRYEAFNETGFFNKQDRFETERALEVVKNAAGVGGFAFAMTETQDVANKDVAAARARLIHTGIDLSRIQALSDAEFFRLIDVMHAHFPAHIRLKSFAITRPATARIDDAVLQKIRARQPVDLFTATASFDWVTIAPMAEGETAPAPDTNRRPKR